MLVTVMKVYFPKLKKYYLIIHYQICLMTRNVLLVFVPPPLSISLVTHEHQNFLSSSRIVYFLLLTVIIYLFKSELKPLSFIFIVMRTFLPFCFLTLKINFRVTNKGRYIDDS